jgi:hypothetical protein
MQCEGTEPRDPPPNRCCFRHLGPNLRLKIISKNSTYIYYITNLPPKPAHIRTGGVGKHTLMADYTSNTFRARYTCRGVMRQ